MRPICTGTPAGTEAPHWAVVGEQEQELILTEERVIVCVRADSRQHNPMLLQVDRRWKLLYKCRPPCEQKGMVTLRADFFLVYRCFVSSMNWAGRSGIHRFTLNALFSILKCVDYLSEVFISVSNVYTLLTAYLRLIIHSMATLIYSYFDTCTV